MSKIKYIGRSVLAFIAAIAVTSILTYFTDVVLVATDIMEANVMPGSVGIVLLLIAYRSFYNVVGAFVLARLAPSRPMTHAIVLGVIGALGGVAGGFALPDTSMLWYPVTLAILTLPSVWLGATLAAKSK